MLSLQSHTISFQLTLPEWGATIAAEERARALYVSTHAPRVGSDQRDAHCAVRVRVSTHTPRAGSD